jgi:sulfur carrier protein
VISIVLNGEPRRLEDGASVRDAALLLGAEPDARGVAVAVDGEVVPRSLLDTRALHDGARVEVVVAIQGGAL